MVRPAGRLGLNDPARASPDSSDRTGRQAPQGDRSERGRYGRSAEPKVPAISSGGSASVAVVPILAAVIRAGRQHPACRIIGLPVRELGGTSTIHLAVADGVHIGRAGGLRRKALRLQERVGYPVAESQQAGSGQYYRQGAAPPDGVG